jgi:hypothetical protein
LNEKVAAPVYKTEINGWWEPLCQSRDTPLPAEVDNNFTDKWRRLRRYSSLAELKAMEFFCLFFIRICPEELKTITEQLSQV